ncbi:uroporphyrinogen-III synthase [Novosphingobium sp. M1R2S20]|uniref:Uroporphyrinogen-III synthase n=1 Tax=Novosphingobium rhizovicinum TaxID=3228928 RepID=A0ABV3RE69_9SPHN
MLPVIIVRPEPGASSTLQSALGMGLDAHAYPIFTVRPVFWTPVPRDAVDAVLVGSANALRHGGAGLKTLHGLPAYCVGQTTAQAAERAGFVVVAVGSGGLQGVLSSLDGSHRRLLRLAGVSHVPLTPPAGTTMDTRIVYESAAVPACEGLTDILKHPAVVLLHSGEAAAHFERICTQAAIDRSRIALAAIGPRVAERAGQGWAMVRSADEPTDAALLALAREMCQDAARVP